MILFNNSGYDHVSTRDEVFGDRAPAAKAHRPHICTYICIYVSIYLYMFISNMYIYIYICIYIYM